MGWYPSKHEQNLAVAKSRVVPKMGLRSNIWFVTKPKLWVWQTFPRPRTVREAYGTGYALYMWSLYIRVLNCRLNGNEFNGSISSQIWHLIWEMYSFQRHEKKRICINCNQSSTATSLELGPSSEVNSWAQFCHAKQMNCDAWVTANFFGRPNFGAEPNSGQIIGGHGQYLVG